MWILWEEEYRGYTVISWVKSIHFLKVLNWCTPYQLHKKIPHAIDPLKVVTTCNEQENICYQCQIAPCRPISFLRGEAEEAEEAEQEEEEKEEKEEKEEEE